MFGRKTRMLEQEIKHLNDRIDGIRNLYWDLSRAHYRLLDHLGLYEAQIPSDVQIRKLDEGKK